MINEATREYVRMHRDDDVRELALQGCKDTAVDLTMALQQIAGRQTARHKLPSWADTEGIVYPPRLNMEQCSSELTARHKAKLIDDLRIDDLRIDDLRFNNPRINIQFVNRQFVNRQFIDLTGGFGVDFAFMADVFSEAVYVERDERLCAIAAHNLAILGKKNVTTVCADARDYLATIPLAEVDVQPTVIFIDPSRRDAHGGRTYALADCTPDVVAMMPGLLSRTDLVMLKLSPMLDWRKAVADLAPHHVIEVHIVAVDNECKELLLILADHASTTRLTCTDIRSADGSCCDYSPGSTGDVPVATGHEQALQAVLAGEPATLPAFLYEPNAAVMKAGCFTELTSDFGMCQIAANSHLFVSDREVTAFPGRRFHIAAACTMNKRSLNATLGHLSHANVAVRNFPLSAEQLRHRLRIADGGTDYIFATTLADGTHTLLLCRRTD